MTDMIQMDRREGILHLVLNRPAKKNALNHLMYSALAEAIDGAAAHWDIRVILISAEGGDFCAGNDIADFVTLATHVGAVADLPVFRFLKALTYAAKPIVFAVQGQAVGIGATMLLHGDLIYLSDDARLSLPFLKLGLTPEGGSSVLLPARVGHARAFEWLTLGEPVAAAAARAAGLANEVIPGATLLTTARAAAMRLAALPPPAVTEVKRLMRDPDILWAQIVREGDVFRARLQSPEAAQAFAAFMKA